MTKEQKTKKLAMLDEQILNLMIKATGDNGDTSLLTELSVGVNYLKSNMMVSEKERSTAEDGIKKRVKEAEKRRAKKEEV